ncbi:MAG TPA: L,D-transpeptidase family protein [Casimicrobiaceae bacterium]|nr:L,D-transpeptidase family protein [Casimicrobiaceae bacterium]
MREQREEKVSNSGASRSLCVFGAALLWILPIAVSWADPSFDARKLAVANRGAKPFAAPELPPAKRAWLDQVYSQASPGPVWFTPEGPLPATGVALDALRNAADRGLLPGDYDVDALEREFAALRAGRREPDAAKRVDEAMTATMLCFLSDLRFGRVPPQQVEPHYRARAKDAVFVGKLRDAVAHDQIAALIDAVEPEFPLYGRLKRLLAEYRSLAALPSIVLPPFAPPRGKIVAGDFYAGAPALRTLLIRLGDLDRDATKSTDERYTQTLADAVRRFQARHGLQPDGVLGRETLAALNVPLATRLTQIRLSLERLRWLPELPPGPLIAINIPSFQLWAFEAASDSQHAKFSMPVVVGKAMRNETPVFIGEMRFVEFSPYWNVPPSILRKELLPRLASDPAYLEREDMELVSTSHDGRTYAVDSDEGIAALRSGEARLRQRPGRGNALGGVKFVLPNTMDIYLHATPATELFERTRRDFSHGCIRVGDPELLAQFVLNGKPEWTPDTIEAAMTSGVNRTVPLAAPLPVIVFYTTALVERDGRPLFLADIYGHDRKLLDALRSSARLDR